MANPVETVVRPIDRWQQRNRPVAFVYGVVKKYGDDRGGMLAALITFYGLLSLFPLFLLATTILGFVLHGDVAWQQRIERSALGQFPLIGPDLRNHSIHGSPFAVVVGSVGSLWGALGVGQMLEFTSDEAWGIPNRQRAPFVKRIARALGFFGLVGLAIVGTSALTVLGSIVGHSEVMGAVGIVAALVLNVGVFLLVFRLLANRPVRWGDLLPGAMVGGIGWQVLQVVGQALVRHNLQHTTALYGEFAVVLGLISFLSLGAQLFVYSLELNVVIKDRLWPRSLVQPPLTSADRRYLDTRAEQEARRPEQQVDVSWRDVPGVDDAPAADGPRAGDGATAKAGTTAKAGVTGGRRVDRQRRGTSAQRADRDRRGTSGR